jgi:diadenosine tetraphosphate (Ap4A) HIT family hydrolase
VEEGNGYDNSECPHCDASCFALRYPLMEVRDFRIVCDAHPLTVGHTLIIPKEHLPCVGAFGCTLFPLFLEVYGLVTSFLRSEFGAYATFEHGVLGQTVHHAHVHLLPFAGSVGEIVPEHATLRTISSMSDLRTIYAKEGGYMLVQINSVTYTVAQDMARPGHRTRGDWRKANNNARLRRCFQRDVHELLAAWKRHCGGDTCMGKLG